MGLNRLLCRGKPWNCIDIAWGPEHTRKHGRVGVSIMARMERERRAKIGMIQVPTWTEKIKATMPMGKHRRKAKIDRHM